MSNLARNLTRTINDQVVLESVLEERKAWSREERRGGRRGGKSPKICTSEDLIRLNQTKEFTLICTSILHTVLKDRAFMAKSKDVWQYLYGLSRFKETLTIHISNQTLATHMGCSVRTIQRYIRFLVEYGYFDIKTSYEARGERVNVITVVTPQKLIEEANQTRDRKKEYKGKKTRINQKITSSSLMSCSKSDRNDSIDVDSFNIYKTNNNKEPRIENEEKENIPPKAESVVPPFDSSNSSVSSVSSDLLSASPVNLDQARERRGVREKVGKADENGDRKGLSGLVYDHAWRCDRDGVARIKLPGDNHSLSCQKNHTTHSSLFKKEEKRLRNHLKGYLKDHLEKLRLRKNELNHVFLNETDQTKKFEALQTLGQAESAYERTVLRLDQLTTQAQEQEAIQEVYSQLQTNPYFVASKPGERKVTEFTLKRILKTLQSYGYKQPVRIRLANEIIQESRFGSLATNNLTKQENSMERSVNIGLKLVREGRWHTPNTMRDFSHSSKNVQEVRYG